MSFRPNEPQEDFYFHVMAASILIGFFFTILVWSHFGTGVKYLLLSNWGVQTSGRVDIVLNQDLLKSLDRDYAINQTIDAIAKNSNFLMHTDLAIISYHPDAEQEQLLEMPQPRGSFTYVVGNTLDVTYFSANPKIAYPTKALVGIEFDSKLLLISAGVQISCLIIMIVTIRRWRLFKRSLRRY